MKASNFRYIRPRSLPQALEILAAHDGAAVPVAGGQSLMAGLNMRLSAPELLVDIGELEELRLSSFGDDEIRLGALTRHREILGSEALRKSLPLLPEAVAHVAHVGIRNRGTLGGSLAYADPAAELPACSVALDATLVIGGLAGEREVKASRFFTGLFETDLRKGELILAVKFPVPRQKRAVAFAELARRHGDFAIAGVAAVAAVEQDCIEDARFVYFGCVDRAKVAERVSAAATGLKLPAAVTGALEEAIAGDLDPDTTPGLRADTKLHLAKVLTGRALGQLAVGGPHHGGH